MAEETLYRLLFILGQAEAGERQRSGLLIQNPDDDLLAVGCRKGRDPQVDRLAIDRHPGAAVLGPESVGNVEPGHDLDPRDEGNACAPGDLHGLPQYPVDAVADDDAAL